MIHRLFNAYVLYPVAERLTGRTIRSKLKVMAHHDALPFHDRKLHASRQLHAVLRHAGEHVPYYRSLFADLEFDPARVEHDLGYLRLLPYLTKEIIRQEGERLLSDRSTPGSLHERKTGGSTGPSAVIRYSQEALDWTAAAHLMAVSLTGKRRHWKEVHLSTRSLEKFPLKDRLKERAKCWAMNRQNIYTDSLDEAGLDVLWREIVKARPYLIQGHPSTIYALSRYVAETQHAIDPPFAVFESTGELLDTKKRKLIEDVLHCRVVNRYGNAEFGVVAYERRGSDREGLRVLDYMVWPETLANDDGSHELVCTGLTNMAMPLIRYRTGDLADLKEEDDGWYLTNLVGRVHEMVTIQNRSYPTHYFQDLIDRIPGIADFQVVEREGKVPLLRLVPEAHASRDLIGEKIRGYWQENVEHLFVIQEDLERLGRRAKFSRLIRKPLATDKEGDEG